MNLFARTTAALAGLYTTVVGVWALFSPDTFADFVRFPSGGHFVHDVGAFQLGIGTTLLLATIWRDALALALAGFVVGSAAHTVVHFLDTDLGGDAWQPWLIGAVTLLVAAALAARLRALGWVVGGVGATANPALMPLVRQKTVVVTTYRRDGRPVGTPVSVAVDGEVAYVRSFERAGKTKRISHNPAVSVAPSTMRGRPTGPVIETTARRLAGAEYDRASRALVRKHPLLHGVLVPLAHRLGRATTGRTVHFELTPGQPGSAAAARPASSSSSVTARKSP